MNPAQQLIAIAIACPGIVHSNEEHAWQLTKSYREYFCPLTDLNHIRLCVETLDDDQYEDFMGHLIIMTGGVPDLGWKFRDVQEAAATQRSEAFLRTLNLWTES